MDRLIMLKNNIEFNLIKYYLNLNLIKAKPQK